MKGMTLDQYKEVVEFTQNYHGFARGWDKNRRSEAISKGVKPKTAEYGYGIKYISCNYDTRDGKVWSITFDNRIRLSANHFTALNPPPKGWKYDNIYELSMAFLKGNFVPKNEFFID